MIHLVLIDYPLPFYSPSSATPLSSLTVMRQRSITDRAPLGLTAPIFHPPDNRTLWNSRAVCSITQDVNLTQTLPVLTSQVVQTAHSWANARVLLGACMHRERGSFRKSSICKEIRTGVLSPVPLQPVNHIIVAVSCHICSDKYCHSSCQD